MRNVFLFLSALLFFACASAKNYTEDDVLLAHDDSYHHYYLFDSENEFNAQIKSLCKKEFNSTLENIDAFKKSDWKRNERLDGAIIGYMTANGYEISMTPGYDANYNFKYAVVNKVIDGKGYIKYIYANLPKETGAEKTGRILRALGNGLGNAATGIKTGNFNGY